MTSSVLDQLGAPFDTDRRPCCFSSGRVLLLQVAISCNQLCRHCMRDALPAKLERMDIPRLHEIFEDRIRGLQVDRVVISGGEPTILPNLTQVVTLASQFAPKITMCSNATLIDPVMARRLAAAGVTSVTVGMEDVGGGYDDYRRSRGGYERAKRGIAALQSAGVPVTVNLTVQPTITTNLDTVVAELTSMQPVKVCVTSPIAQGRMVIESASLNYVDSTEFYRFVSELRLKLGRPIMVRIPRCRDNSCPSRSEVFSVGATGIVSGCPDEGAQNVIDMTDQGECVANANLY